MPVFRGAHAEVRRSHRTAEWVLTGVVVGGDWFPAHRSIERPSRRMIESGLVALVELPTFIAPDVAAAVEAALWLASEARLLDISKAPKHAVVRGSRAWRI